MSDHDDDPTTETDEPTPGPEGSADDQTQEDAGLSGGGGHAPVGEPTDPEEDDGN